MHILFIRLLVPVFIQRKYERSKDFRLKLSLRQHSSMKVNAQGHMAHMKQVAIGSNPAASHSKQSDYDVQSWAARAKLLFGMWMRSADVQDPSLPRTQLSSSQKATFKAEEMHYFLSISAGFWCCSICSGFPSLCVECCYSRCGCPAFGCLDPQREHSMSHRVVTIQRLFVFMMKKPKKKHKKHSFPVVRLLIFRLKFVDFLKRISLLVE